MIPREILKKIRRIEIRTNRIVRMSIFFCLALALSHDCHAALVQDLSSSKREIATTNINLKVSGRTYFVGVDKIASGKLLSAAKTGQSGFSGDRFDSAIPEALRLAERSPQVLKQDYEPRLLGIPAIYFVAVWLHGKSDDIIIPLPPTFERWKAYELYTEKEMIKLLQSEAQKVLKKPNLIR